MGKSDNILPGRISELMWTSDCYSIFYFLYSYERAYYNYSLPDHAVGKKKKKRTFVFIDFGVQKFGLEIVETSSLYTTLSGISSRRHEGQGL